MLRTTLCLAALFAATNAYSAAVHISIGGDFHLTPGDGGRLIFTSDHTGGFRKQFLTQLPAEERHEFAELNTSLNYVQLLNQSRYLAGDSAHAQQWHFGYWLSEAPNAYMDATSIEMIGGPIVEIGGGKLAQEWTYIVNGGAPEVVQVKMIPEPAAGLLAVVALMAALQHRSTSTS